MAAFVSGLTFVCAPRTTLESHVNFLVGIIYHFTVTAAELPSHEWENFYFVLALALKHSIMNVV